MQKKFAYVVMGEHYDPAAHRAAFETENQVTLIRTVRNFDEARQTILELAADGVGAIELCGAFGEEKARECAALTNNKVAFGFIKNLPEHQELVHQFFGH